MEVRNRDVQEIRTNMQEWTTKGENIPQEGHEEVYTNKISYYKDKNSRGKKTKGECTKKSGNSNIGIKKYHKKGSA